MSEQSPLPKKKKKKKRKKNPLKKKKKKKKKNVETNLVSSGSNDINSALDGKLLERVGARGASGRVNHVNTSDGEYGLDDLVGFLVFVGKGLGIVAVGRAVGARGLDTVGETVDF